MENLFQKGIDYFNNGYYFEAHDTFEELWMNERDEAIKFYQGLVQLATGCYHLVMKNLRGAESQLSKSAQKLSLYEPTYRNIDIIELVKQVQDCIQKIQHNAKLAQPNYKEIIALIPKIETRR